MFEVLEVNVSHTAPEGATLDIKSLREASAGETGQVEQDNYDVDAA